MYRTRRIKEKTNEITAISEVIKRLNLKKVKEYYNFIMQPKLEMELFTMPPDSYNSKLK